jgi:hydrogenase maturation protease
MVCIAIGNPLRGDDGVAHRVLELLGPRDGVLHRSVHQLTPDLALEISIARKVIFIDADPLCACPRVDPLPPNEFRRPSPLAHTMTAAEVVSLAHHLYGFAGAAFLCRVPAANFDGGEKLTLMAESGARSTAESLEKLLAS